MLRQVQGVTYYSDLSATGTRTGNGKMIIKHKHHIQPTVKRAVADVTRVKKGELKCRLMAITL